MPGFSQSSVLAMQSQPGVGLASSQDAGWKSLYVQEWQCPSHAEEFDALETPDQTVVVFLQGAAVLESWQDRHWHAAYRSPGSVGLTAPDERDRLRWRSMDDSPVRAAYIYLPQELISQAGEELRQPGQRASVAALSALRHDDPTLFGLAHGLVAAVRSKAPELYARSAAIFLASHLATIDAAKLRRDRTKQRISTAVAERRTHRAIDYMREHLASDVTLAALAKEAAVSEFYFVRIFKERTGFTPSQYLHRMRMERAHELLATTEMPIAEVALLCGYGNHSAFSAAVRSHSGLSPSILRKRGLSATF